MRSLLLKSGFAALLLMGTTSGLLAQNLARKQQPARQIGRSLQATGYVYDNRANFQFSGASTGASTLVGTNRVTLCEADDITFPAGYAGRQVTEFHFAVANFNATAVTARPIFSFWLADGPDTGDGPGPGTPYDISNGSNVFGIGFVPIAFPGGNVVSTYNYNPPAGTFFLPSATTLWVGISFDNNSGATGATATQLNNLGVGLYGNPVSGSSQDLFFELTAFGPNINVANPPGTFYYFGGPPTLANFGYGFAIETFTLSGQVTLEENPPTAGIPITVEFKQGTNVILTRTTTLDASGNFTVPLVPADTFDVYVKAPKWLKKKVAAVNLTAADVTTFAVTLKAGDSNNDNAVDVTDLIAVINSYNQTLANNPMLYLQGADFNGDGANDVADLLTVIRNYNQLGD